MIEALILIPTHATDGAPIQQALQLEVRRRLVDLSGGLTVPREVDGVWVGPDGLEYSESMLPHVVFLSSWWQLPTFLLIAEWACEAFEQRAVAVRIAGLWEFWPSL